MDSARELKRAHRTLFRTDPQGFREQVKKANSRVFRLKPGPKADARITKAARERASGVPWGALYTTHIDGYGGTMSEYTRDLLEAGFRKKVMTYLQKHPNLKHKWANGIR